jgi:hypothetical protein
MDRLGQGLAPGVQHCRDPNFGAEVFGIAGKLLHGLGSCLEQQGVEGPLVHANERIEVMG